MNTIIYLLLFGLFLLIIKIYKYLTNNFDYWEKRNVKYLKPIPFFGNYFDIALGIKDTGTVMTEIANRFPNEKVVGIFQGKRPTLIVKDPNLVRDITTKYFWHFSERNPHFENFKFEPLDMNLFAIGGPRWKVIRTNFSPIFSSTKMKNMLYLLHECNEQFQKYIDSQVKKANVLDIYDMCAKYTMEAIGSCVFGLQMNNINEDSNEFRRIGHKFFKGSKTLSFKMFLKMAMPDLWNIFYLKARDTQVVDFFLNITKKMIEIRKTEGTQRHDIIDTLIKLLEKKTIVSDVQNHKGEQNVFQMDVNHELLAAQTFVFYAAGFETSSSAMAMTLYELAKNPHIQRRLHKDIDNALKKTNGEMTYDMINELTYLDMVLSETMRLHPAVASLTRMCCSKFTFEEIGLTIDEGVLIQLAIKYIHDDPNNYSDPQKFDPERFSSTNKSNIRPCAYLPFGEGPRICIGMRLGKLQTMVGLIGTLSKYRIEKTPLTCNELQMNPCSHTVWLPSNRIYLKFVPRI